jgi:transcriptional regulator with XRE-family HTH domain
MAGYLRARENLHLGREDRWRGRLPIPSHAHPLVRRLFEIINEQRATIQEVADKAGVQRGSISDWRYRNSPLLSTFEAALNAVGYKLVIMRDTWRPRGPGRKSE